MLKRSLLLCLQLITPNPETEEMLWLPILGRAACKTKANYYTLNKACDSELAY